MSLLVGVVFSTACGAGDSPGFDSNGDESVEQLSSPLLASGVCDLRTAQSMNPWGSYSNLSGGARRLLSAGSGVGFYNNPPVATGTWKVTFYLRATNDGTSAPRARIRRGTTLLGEVTVNNTSSYQAYTLSFSNSSQSATQFSLEYVGASSARSLEVLRAELTCPPRKDAPGVVCLNSVCQPGDICCDGTSVDRGVFCVDPETQPGECGVFHFPMHCDGPSDCPSGSMCVLSAGDRGASTQCAVGTPSTLTAPLICGSRTIQTYACPTGYTCGPAGAEGIGFRLCVRN